jgi:hypothetical protein
MLHLNLAFIIGIAITTIVADLSNDTPLINGHNKPRSLVEATASTSKGAGMPQLKGLGDLSQWGIPGLDLLGAGHAGAGGKGAGNGAPNGAGKGAANGAGGLAALGELAAGGMIGKPGQAQGVAELLPALLTSLIPELIAAAHGKKSKKTSATPTSTMTITMPSPNNPKATGVSASGSKSQSSKASGAAAASKATPSGNAAMSPLPMFTLASATALAQTTAAPMITQFPLGSQPQPTLGPAGASLPGAGIPLPAGANPMFIENRTGRRLSSSAIAGIAIGIPILVVIAITVAIYALRAKKDADPLRTNTSSPEPMRNMLSPFLQPEPSMERAAANGTPFRV